MCDSGRKDTLPTQMHTTFWIAGLPQEMSFKFVWGSLWHTFSLWRTRSETISCQSLWNIGSCFYNYAVSPVQIASRNEREPLPFALSLQASPIITLQVSAHTHFLKDGWHDPYFFFFFLAMLPENRREPSKSFDSYSIQRLGYNLHLREPLNCGAGMGRCNRRRNTISVLCFCTRWQDNGHEEHVVIPMFKRGLNCTYTLLKSPPDIQCSETVPLNIKKVTELLSAFSQFPGTKQIKMDNSKTCCKQVFHILLQGTGTVPGSPSSIDKAFGIEHRYLGCLFLCLCL